MLLCRICLFLEYHSFIGSVLQLPVWLHTGNFSFSKIISILVSSFYVLNRIKGRGPQKEQKEGDGFDG